MKLGISAGYGLITMMYIAQKDKLVLSQEIAQKCHIPLDYLLKVLQQLVTASITKGSGRDCDYPQPPTGELVKFECTTISGYRAVT